MSFIRQGLLSITGLFAQALVSFLAGIILARGLSPDGLGQYSLVISLVTIIGAITSLGLGNAAIFHVNNRKREAGEIIPTVIKVSVLLALFSFAVALIVFQFESYFGPMAAWSIFVVAVYSFGIVMFDNLLKIPMVFLRVGQYVIARFVPGFIFLCLMVLAYFGTDLTTQGAWLYVATGQIFAVILLLFFVREYLFVGTSIKQTDVRALASYGAKLNLTYIALLLHSEIGLFLVRYFTDDFTEVGYYRLAIRLAGVLLMFPKAISPLFFSKWSMTEMNVRLLEVQQVSRIFYLMTFIGILIIELIADDFILVVYGAAYAQAAPVLKIILIGIGFRFVLMPVFSLFTSSGRPLFSTYSYLVGLVVTVLMMCFLIPDYGSIGAGFSFTAGYAATLVFCYFLAWKYLGLKITKCLIMMPEDFKFLRDKLSKTGLKASD